MNLSVMIPTKNRLIHIKRAINSLIQQSISISELVVADAGSTDGTLEFLENLRREVEFPIKIVCGERRLNNWLVGIRSCKYDHVLILCDDDIVHPKLNANFQRLKLSYPAAALYCFRQCVAFPNSSIAKSFVSGSKWTEGYWTGHEAEKQLIKNGFPGFPSMIINKKLLEFDANSLSLFEESDYLCDLFLCSDAISAGGIAFSNYVASTFYFHPHSQSVTDGLKLFYPYWAIKISKLFERKQLELARHFTSRHDKRLFRYIVYCVGNMADKHLSNIWAELENGEVYLKSKIKLKLTKFLLKSTIVFSLVKWVYQRRKKDADPSKT